MVIVVEEKSVSGPAFLLLTDLQFYKVLRELVSRVGNNHIWLMASCVYFFAQPASRLRIEISCITSGLWSV